MLRHLFKTFILLIISLQLCHASELIERYVPDAELVGEGRLRIFFRDIYDAKLIAPNGKLDYGQPFALELNYLMNVTGKKITDYSIKQILKQDSYSDYQINKWTKDLQGIFPDVSKGQVITGIYTTDGESIFLSDNKFIGQLEDRVLSKAFFDIWISEKTTNPKLRKKLLGET